MPTSLWLARVFASLASAWLLVVLVLTKIVGPLNPDEVMFSHTLWLTLQGQKQFIDFYSYHFPTYFFLYDLVLPRGNSNDLAFVWAVRLSNLLVVATYVAFLFVVERRSAFFLLPLLLLFLFLSRMVEVRPDTLGLLAFNGAWAALMVGKSRYSLILAAVLAIFGAACSARGVVMGVGFGAAVTWRAFIQRDWRYVAIPTAVFAIALLIMFGAYAADSSYVELMLRSTLLDPGAALPHLTLTQRLLGFDRLPQVLMSFTAMLIGLACVVRGEARERSGVIAIAALSQLLLIFFDPSPFPYVYAWSIIPSLGALPLSGRLMNIDARIFIATLGSACAAILAAAIILYSVITGREAPVGSNYRVLLDPALPKAEIRRMSLEGLIRLELSRSGQQSLANQLLVREELCRRVPGRVLAVWQSHPICLADAAYDWWSFKWPNITATGSGAPPRWFIWIFQASPPDLFIWNTGIRGAPLTLNRWATSLLHKYCVQPGFAIRRDLLRGAIDSSGRAANRPNNGRK